MKKNRIFIYKISKYIIGILFIGGCFLLSCKSQGTNKTSNDESFDEFYARFHADSVFQMKRIEFPLPGINTDEMGTDESDYQWEEEDWEIHYDMNLDTTEFIIENNITDSLAIEKIYKENTGFSVERTFKKIGGKWFLVYYKDVNL